MVLPIESILQALKDMPEEISALFCRGNRKLGSHLSVDHESNSRNVEELIMLNLELLLQKAESGGKLWQFALQL